MFTHTHTHTYTTSYYSIKFLTYFLIILSLVNSCTLLGWFSIYSNNQTPISITISLIRILLHNFVLMLLFHLNLALFSCFDSTCDFLAPIYAPQTISIKNFTIPSTNHQVNRTSLPVFHFCIILWLRYFFCWCKLIWRFHSLYHDEAFCTFNCIFVAWVGRIDRNHVSAQIWELGFMKLRTLV